MTITSEDTPVLIAQSGEIDGMKYTLDSGEF